MPATARGPIVAPGVAVHASQPAAVHLNTGPRTVIGGISLHSRPTGAVVRTTRRPKNTRVTRLNNDLGEEEFSQDFSPVPGLGFDIPHLAATQGRRAVGARRHRRNFALSFPLFGGGIFVPVSPLMEEEAPAIDMQQEATEPEVAHTVRRARVPEATPTYAPEAPLAPQHEADEYVFVRRDGTLIFAVAYAWESGTLRYVTREGLRRSVTGDSLDLGATQQFNEQRGLRFHLPA